MDVPFACVIPGVDGESGRRAPRSGAPDPDACLSPHISTETIVGVTGIEVLRKDIRVRKGIRPGIQLVPNRNGFGGQRGAVREFSQRSRLNLSETVRNTEIIWGSMACLSYPVEFPADGRLVKKHLRAFLEAMKRRYGPAVAYLWFLEFQKRGAPHIHILCGHLVEVDREWLAATWFRIVGSADPKHYRVHCHEKQWQEIYSEDGCERYVAKYAHKTFQKEVPEGFENVGRFWGHSANVKPKVYAVAQMDEAELIKLVGFDKIARFLGVKESKMFLRCRLLYDLGSDAHLELLGREAVCTPLPRMHPVMIRIRKDVDQDTGAECAGGSWPSGGLSRNDRTPAGLCHNLTYSVQGGGRGLMRTVQTESRACLATSEGS
jgi:hypothetical protein